MKKALLWVWDKILAVLIVLGVTGFFAILFWLDKVRFIY